MNDDRSRYAVRIEFEDDEPYEITVIAQDSTRAFFLALQDSRMGSPFGSFQSPVTSWQAELSEEVAA